MLIPTGRPARAGSVRHVDRPGPAAAANTLQLARLARLVDSWHLTRPVRVNAIGAPSGWTRRAPSGWTRRAPVSPTRSWRRYGG
jgi:hypothetical protein